MNINHEAVAWLEADYDHRKDQFVEEVRGLERYRGYFFTLKSLEDTGEDATWNPYTSRLNEADPQSRWSA